MESSAKAKENHPREISATLPKASGTISRNRGSTRREYYAVRPPPVVRGSERHG